MIKRLVLLLLTLFGVGDMMVGVCHAEDITIRYDGSKVKVRQTKRDSVTVTVDGACVNVESLYESRKITLLLKGKSDDGQLNLKTAGKAKVTLDGLTLTSQEGAPLRLNNKKKVEVVVAKGSKNTLTITACNDTVNHKAAVIWAKDKLLLSGKGTLDIVATGDGCRGIKSKKDITIEDVTLNVTTSGDNLGEKPFGFGGFPGMPEGGFEMPEGGFPNFPDSFPGFPGGGFPNFPDSIPMMGGFPGFPGGGFPMGGFPGFGNREEGDSIPGDFGDFGDFGGGFGGGFGGKHKYVASTKGIASKGVITINSGNVTVRTSTAGAEGIEGKEGVIFNGGNVDVLSPDDAINAGACIEFNGAHVVAHSLGNDAVDSNPKGGFFMPFGNNAQSNEPAIIIRGGTVYAWSEVGSPEEGLDCDFASLVVEGGKVFTVGGGMGEMPSVPTNETAHQPTALLIGLNIAKDEPVSIYDAGGKLLDTVTIPFSMRRSASLVSSPVFQVGNSYTVKTKDYEKTITFNENFIAVR